MMVVASIFKPQNMITGPYKLENPFLLGLPVEARVLGRVVKRADEIGPAKILAIPRVREMML